MVPSRVIERTIRRLQYGWMPFDGESQARTASGSIVSYQHPDAAQFNSTTAVMRAIFELTNKPAVERDELWSRTLVPMMRKSGKTWSQWYDFMHHMTKEECLEYYSNYLKDLRNYDS